MGRLAELPFADSVQVAAVFVIGAARRRMLKSCRR